MKFNFIRDEKVKKWSKKFGYHFYVNIFHRLSVQRIISSGYESCQFDKNIPMEKITDLILKSVDENKDFIAPYIIKSRVPKGAII